MNREQLKRAGWELRLGGKMWWRSVGGRRGYQVRVSNTRGRSGRDWVSWWVDSELARAPTVEGMSHTIAEAREDAVAVAQLLIRKRCGS